MDGLVPRKNSLRIVLIVVAILMVFVVLVISIL
jgi:hypothetical protein